MPGTGSRIVTEGDFSFHGWASRTFVGRLSAPSTSTWSRQEMLTTTYQMPATAMPQRMANIAHFFKPLLPGFRASSADREGAVISSRILLKFGDLRNARHAPHRRR